MTPTAKAALILRALSGNHLRDWLPGEDHKAAISYAVGTHHEWCGGEECGRVTKRGIETFDSLDSMFHGSPVVVIPWREVLQAVERGCTDGRREAYEAAFARWNEWARSDGYTIKSSRTTPEEREERYQRFKVASDGIHDTTAAIITAGCERALVQPELF